MSVLPPILQTSLTYPLVIGCSVFGIAWGVVNILMVSHLLPTLSDRRSAAWSLLSD